MLSKYLRVKERDGAVAIFHELHPDPVYCSFERWTKFTEGDLDGAESLVQDLKRCKLLINEEREDEREFELVSSELGRKLNQPNILYLMTAQGCNFSCGYCPVPETAKKYGDSRLSPSAAIAGIDLWREHLQEGYDPKRQYTVIFYGGEPLLNKETIKVALAYIRKLKEAGQLPAAIKTMIATNGALIDEEMISLCKEHDVSVGVGLDGPKSSNDTLKVDVEGRGTFDRIAATIRLLVDSGVTTFASVSITPHNIDEIAAYSEFLGKLGIEKFGFNFLKGKKLLELVGREGLEDYYLKAARGVIESHLRQGERYFEYQMEKKIFAFEEKDFFPVDCTCYGNQLVIQPDGQISNCPFFKAGLGRIEEVGKDFRIANQPIVKEWRQRLPLYNPDFKQVDAKAICGGGCAWSSSELKGDPIAVDDSSRVFAEEVFNELVWSRLGKQTIHGT